VTPDVRVTVEPNGSGVLLPFAEDCPYCGRRHNGHGASSAMLGPDGSYGHRTTHCARHTHAVTAGGRRGRLTASNECPNDHEGYRLVPA
jgi:hypothetical protein